MNGLLNGIKSQAVNEKTFKALSDCLQKINITEHENTQLQNSVRDNFAKRLSVGKTESEAIAIINRETALPVGAIMSLCLVKNDDSAIKTLAGPDWSWQQIPIEKAREALAAQNGLNSGLIIPTGGGKTTIAIEALIPLIISGTCKHSAWVAHRDFLLNQAKGALKNSIDRLRLSPKERQKVQGSMEFLMVHEADENIHSLEEKFDTLIIDEAHHAAAKSYKKIVGADNLTGLFLTATPNRLDKQPIGIDDICFQAQPRLLFESGCIIRPELKKFESNQFQSVFENNQSIREFAAHILDNLLVNYNKSLICVPLIDQVTDLHDALCEELNLGFKDHHLLKEDLMFIHANKNSLNKASREVFFDEFHKLNSGVLVATSPLVGEGLDVPSIDSVYVTYQSESISHLLQIAGRALRHDSGKQAASIIQVRGNDLNYFFNAEWLYQDITDRLRPKTSTIEYFDKSDLREKLKDMLEAHNTNEKDSKEFFESLDRLNDENFRVFFVGINYYGPKDKFTTNSKWRPILVREDDTHFVPYFNELCYANEVQDKASYARKMSDKVISLSSASMATDLVNATNWAKQEILKHEWDLNHRGKSLDGSSTWLHNVSIRLSRASSRLEEFLQDCANKHQVLEQFQQNHLPFAVKFKNPITQYHAILLDEKQYHWILKYLVELDSSLQTDMDNQWLTVAKHNVELTSCPLPIWALNQLHQLLDPEQKEVLILNINQEAV